MVPRLIAVFLLVAPVALATPISISTTGYVVSAADQPLENPSATISFSLWSDATSTSARVWPASGASTCTVAVKAGYYSVLLDGSLSSGCGALLDSSHLGLAPRWLEVSVEGVTLSPRTRLVPAPVSADAQALVAALTTGGASVNSPGNPVDWKALKGVPASLADGVDADTTYTAGDGLALTGGTFSVAPGSVTNAMLANPAVTITAGTGLSGGGSATLGGAGPTLSLPTTLSNPGTFTHPTLTIDAQGRITSAASGSVAGGTVTSIATGGGLTGGPITGSGTISVASDGITSTHLASDGASLGKVTNGQMTTGPSSIGIGTNNPATTVLLDVNGSAQMQRLFLKNAGVQRFELNKSGTNEVMIANDDTSDVYFEVGSKISSTRAYNGAMRVWGAQTGAWTNVTELGQVGSSYGYLKSSAGLALQPSGGNVGIGTSTPGSLLTLVQSQNTLSYLDFYNTDPGANAGVNFRMVTKDSTGTGTGVLDIVKYRNGYFTINNSDPAAVVAFGTGAAATERLRIAANGNVGIASTVPDRLLDVGGTVQATAASQGAGTDGAIRIKGPATSTQTSYIQFVNHTGSTQWSYISGNANGNIGIGTTLPGYTFHVAGTVAGSGAYVNTSDVRLKTDLRPLTDGLARLDGLRAYTFRWKDPAAMHDAREQIGFVAQDVERVFPQAVSEDAEGHKAVAYSMLLPPTVEAVKDVARTTEAHERRLATVEARNAALESELWRERRRADALEKRLVKLERGKR